MDIMHILGYLGAVLTGLVLGLLGGGGALLSIPVLVYLFNIPADIATGYSLFLVGVTASSGAVQNIYKKLVDRDAVFYYGVPSMITVYTVRRFVMPALPDVFFTVGSFTLDKNHFILTILSLVMFGAGYKMITGGEPTEHTDGQNKTLDHIKLPLYAIAVGAFLGLVGAGGGFLMIPALVYFAHLPMRRAVATSLVLVAANSFIGFIGDIHSNPHTDWKFLLTFSAFSITGVLAGSYLERHISAKRMKSYFGWFVISVAVFMIVKEMMR